MAGFQVFLIPERLNKQGQIVQEHPAVPFETWKDVKQACATCGPTAPFTLAGLEGLEYETLPPCDWKTTARACLSGEMIDCGKANGLISVKGKPGLTQVTLFPLQWKC